MASDPSTLRDRYPVWQSPSVVITAAATAFVIMIVLSRLHAPLADGVPAELKSRWGIIVDFELAGTEAKSREFIESWKGSERIRVGFGLGLDYLLIAAYVIGSFGALTLIGRILGEHRGRHSMFARAAVAIAWGAVAAGLLDAIENAALLRILLRGPEGSWAQTAASCAGLKFILLAVAMTAVLLLGPAAYRVRRGPEQ